MTGAPWPHHLREHHPGQRFRVLLGQGARQRDRRHRPGQGERGDAHDLVALGEGHDPLEHRRIEPERRAGVHDREHRRLVVEGGVVDPPRDPDHLEHVDVALAAEAVAVDRLVHERQRVVRRVEVPDAVMEVHRLHRVARQEVDGVERLSQPQQVLVVHAVADAPPAIEVRHVRRAADRSEGHPVAAELQVVLGVRGVQRERRRCRLDRLGDHVRVEADALRIRRRLGPGGAQHLPGVGVEEVHAELGQDAQRGVVDRLELVGRQRPRSARSACGAGRTAAASAGGCARDRPARRCAGAAAPGRPPSPCPSRVVSDQSPDRSIQVVLSCV